MALWLTIEDQWRQVADLQRQTPLNFLSITVLPRVATKYLSASAASSPP